MCPPITSDFANIFGSSGMFSGNDPGKDAANATLDAARIAAEASNHAADVAAAAIRDAAAASAAGMVDAANIAAEEGRRAQEAAIAYQQEAVAKATQILDSSLGQTSATIVKTQQEALAILDQYGDKSADLYRPYVEYGLKAAGELQKMSDQGVQVPTDLSKSAYYPLYQFQQDQQQKAIDKQLAARGLYNSGSGLEQQIKADTGLTQSFTADEYARAIDDYNRKLGIEGTLLETGYSATGNLANIYQALGANKSGVVQWGGGALANLQNQTAQSKANAAIGQGNSSSAIAMQTGNQLANIATGLGSGLSNISTNQGNALANTYNNQGNQLANIYMNQGNSLASIYNQAARDRNNMYAGLANTALSGYLRSTMNRQTTQQMPTTNYSGYNTSGYENSYPDYGGADWGGYGGYSDVGYW